MIFLYRLRRKEPFFLFHRLHRPTKKNSARRMPLHGENETSECDVSHALTTRE